MEAVTRSIGTELLFENEAVRVWQMTLEPGESSELHRHDADYVFVYVTPSNRLRTHLQDSQPLDAEFDEGYVQYNVVGAHDARSRFAHQLPHRLQNVGEQTHRQILVELLGESASSEGREPESNGRRT